VDAVAATRISLQAAASNLFFSHSGEETLARRTNYKFEKMERDRAKAAKKAARLKAKADKRNQDTDTEDNDNPSAVSPDQSNPDSDRD
jgi:hypothetical protein